MKKILFVFVFVCLMVAPALAQDLEIVTSSGVTMAWDNYDDQFQAQTNIYIVKFGESKDEVEPSITTDAGILQADIHFAEPGVYTLGFQSFEIVEGQRFESRIVWTDVDADAMLNGETMVFRKIGVPKNIRIVQ
jgi:hypothetical protein